MTGFDDMKKSHEAQYAHNEKCSFDVEARCSKLYGLWAAEKLGLDGADAKSYAMEVVEANLEEPGFDDVIRKVRADFEQKALDISEHTMRTELDLCLEEARRQIMDKKK